MRIFLGECKSGFGDSLENGDRKSDLQAQALGYLRAVMFGSKLKALELHMLLGWADFFIEFYWLRVDWL